MALKYYLSSGIGELSSIVLSIYDCFAIRDLLHFHTNFRVPFSSSVNHWSFDGVY